jgi:GTP-binding protein EngB required for normal cell division
MVAPNYSGEAKMIRENVESRLLLWYDEKARPFLAKHALERLAPLDNDKDRLIRLLGVPDRVTVCFLGNSGIGKSTLINALAAGDTQLLPAGGIGPLTALATEVHYSETPAFSVKYHPRGVLSRIRFAVEQRLHRDNAATPPPGEDEAELSPEDLAAIADEFREPAESGAPVPPRAESYVTQARQIVTDNQFGDAPLPYLADALRLACSQQPKWNAAIGADDTARVERIKRVFQEVAKGAAVSFTQGGDADAFKRELHAHAAGFLAPLIQEIQVGWPSELLRGGLVLVDLPGVGIASDTYREVTKRYVREQARAVVLVVDRAGPTDAAITLLRSSGYWDRVVLASDDPTSDPCHLLLVITRVDDVALEEWSQQPKDLRPKKRVVFSQLVERMREQMRTQAAQQLQKLSDVPTESEAIRTARQSAATHVLENLQVHPVSAPEYRRLQVEDEEDPSFFDGEDGTGIPRLAAGLGDLAQQDSRRRQEALRSVVARLTQAIAAELDIVRGQWADTDRAAHAADRLRADLEMVLAPKRKEQLVRQGQFREFLNGTSSSRIGELVLEARQTAEKDVSRYLASLHDANWATLRAAVRRGGTFHGARAINLPDDITSYFQEPIAAVWGQKLLKDIRKRTGEMASDTAAMVDEVCTWAKANGGSEIRADVIERHQERVKQNAAQMNQVGKEAVDDLRTVVKQKLMEVIKKPISKSCEQFVQRGEDIGPGVKSRILELFRDLAGAATEAAREPATRVLRSNFMEVRSEIQGAFEQWGDPLEQAADLIVARHEERVRRSDAQRRRLVLDELDDVTAALPELPTS